MQRDNTKQLSEKIIMQEQYIEALKGTVEDLKAALNTISLMDDLKDIHKIANEMLNDFYINDPAIKLTTLQKEKDK